jgi:hypothetical protein
LAVGRHIDDLKIIKTRYAGGTETQSKIFYFPPDYEMYHIPALP